MATTERDVFSELFWKIRNLKYVPSESEMAALKHCESEAYRRAMMSSAAVGAVTMGLMVVSGAFKARKTASYAISLCNAAVGGYYGAKSTSSYCLECLVKLDSPIGGELAVIMARRCPESPLANASPWAQAIQAAGRSVAESGNFDAQAPDTETTSKDLDVSQRIATPEAIAALRAERQKSGLEISPSPAAQPRKGSPANSTSSGVSADESDPFGSFFPAVDSQAQAEPAGAAKALPVPARRRGHMAAVSAEDSPHQGYQDLPGSTGRRRSRGISQGNDPDGTELADPWGAPSSDNDRSW